jgi:hypothetical protein
MDFLTDYVYRLFYYAEKQKLQADLYNLNLTEFFNFLAAVPYKKQALEDVSRSPVDIINSGGDCGEKAKVFLSYLLHRRFLTDVVFLRVPGGYHVFLSVYNSGRWVDLDPTYGDLKIGERFNYEEAARIRIEQGF